MKELKFLVTTDNHLGYKESDFIRQKDSFLAFEEALQVARDLLVDFVILGGDLFHVNVPSPFTEHECIRIIRQHNSSSISQGQALKIVGGKFCHRPELGLANFEDSKLNVYCPILTIHGNHDDPTGSEAQSVCAKLATSGLVNYFGDVSYRDNEIITVEPIILEKYGLKLALYGMGFIPDIKLVKAFDKGLINFTLPPDDTFNILVVHQNRVPFCKSKYIPDEKYPSFIHLLIRGHEHQALEPEKNLGSKVDGLVYQPGSTIATSISVMESNPKNIAVFSLGSDNAIRYEILKLKSHRPMLFKDISQKEITSYMKEQLHKSTFTESQYRELSRQYVVNAFEDLLANKCPNNQTSTISPDRKRRRRAREAADIEIPKHFRLPLVRIRVEYTCPENQFDELDVSHQFYPSRVANRDIVLFKKQKLQELQDGKTVSITFDEGSYDAYTDTDPEGVNIAEEHCSIEATIQNYFNEKPVEDRLKLLSLSEYLEAVNGSREDGGVISKIVNQKKQRVLGQYLDMVENVDIASKYHEVSEAEKWFVESFQKSSRKKTGVARNLSKKIDGDEFNCPKLQ